MLRAKTWFAAVPSGDTGVLLSGQADFIRQFMGQLFNDLDAGHLPGVTSLHFHRLGAEVRFRVVGPAGAVSSLESDIDQRLAAAQSARLIVGFRSEPQGDWETPDSTYGTDVAGVAPPFTQFMEAVSRATLAFLSAGGTAVPDHILWQWLHLIHNPMTGIERHIVEVAPASAVYRL